MLIRNMRLLVEALEANGAPAPTELKQRGNGQHVARVFPADIFDRLKAAGIIEGDRTLEDVREELGEVSPLA